MSSSLLRRLRADDAERVAALFDEAFGELGRRLDEGDTAGRDAEVVLPGGSLQANLHLVGQGPGGVPFAQVASQLSPSVVRISPVVPGLRLRLRR